MLSYKDTEVDGNQTLSREIMAAVAIFSCRPNSNSFQERHMSLHEPVKIGRAVARTRSSPNNGIFDCKVLSRNHALLWYENGKFFLQDTKSSNGTFVNNQRLSKGSEESPPREIFSGDLIQFGVDVMENNRRGEKITHGCIIAQVTLFHADGREAKSLPFLNQVCPSGTSVQSQELYQLAHYLQEALHREQMLEQKLASLQKLIQNTQEASESGWQALIDEDRLLSRLEVLESQLQMYSKNHSEDTLRQELVALQEDKHKYETTAKESLRRVLQEKLDAVRKLSDLERSLGNTEDECSQLKESCEASQKELQLLAEKYDDRRKEVKELQEKLQEAERNHEEERERVEQEKQELQGKLDEMVKQEAALSAKVESLLADNDFTKQQLSAVKAKMEALKEKSDENNKNELDTDGSNVEIIPLNPKDQESMDLEEKLLDVQKQIEEYKTKLETSENKLRESADQVEQLQKELAVAKHDSNQYMARIASLEEKLKLSDIHMNQMVESTMADINLQLKETNRQKDSSFHLMKDLQDQVSDRESELYKFSCMKGDTTLVSNSLMESMPENISHNGVQNHTSNPHKGDIEHLNALLRETRETHKNTEQELAQCKRELEEARLKLLKSTEEAAWLKDQLLDAQNQAKAKGDMVLDLQDQVKKADVTTKEVKQQILDLRAEHLAEEQSHKRRRQEVTSKLTRDLNSLKSEKRKASEEIVAAKRELATEKTEKKKVSEELVTTKWQLQEAQQTAKQSKNEAEQLRNKVKVLQEELEKSKPQSHGRASLHTETQKTSTSRNKEFAALKEECSNLKKRIQAIEAEMRMSRKENLQLSSDYNKLQESYKELEALKEKLENKELTWMLNLTDAQKDAEQAKMELTLARREIVTLEEKITEYKAEISRLHDKLDSMSAEFQQVADRSKMLSLCSSLPLLVLMFAILLALYPMLAEITFTTS
ncbi:sarcolemmal membrane-associated protein-like isoform X3 [Liolophura sinensis]|uniref:sarcolemmal membrane-associated protein-like isoform X3 n=1 Tax=Liolophura sinensis TaxID=3198878 RepID=UPI003158864C